MDSRRIQFDTNVEESIDATERFWKRAPAGRSQRRRGIVGVAATFTASMIACLFLASGASVRSALPLILLALVLGAAFWPVYGLLYDRGWHRRLRRS